MRIIDADAFYQDICDSIEQMTKIGVSIDAEYLWAKLHDALSNAPSIDICFCRECKYAHMTYDGECKYCDMWKDEDGFLIEVYHDMNFFCGYGERRDSEKPNNSKGRERVNGLDE